MFVLIGAFMYAISLLKMRIYRKMPFSFVAGATEVCYSCKCFMNFLHVLLLARMPLVPQGLSVVHSEHGILSYLTPKPSLPLCSSLPLHAPACPLPSPRDTPQNCCAIKTRAQIRCQETYAIFCGRTF